MKFMPFVLLLALVLSMWLLPSATPALGIVLIVISLALAVFAIVRKHTQAYRQGRITRPAFLRNVFLDVLGILLAVTLAALLGRTLIGLATRSIDDDLTRLILGLVVGLLVGVGVGILVSRAWGRFVKTSA